MPKKTEKINVTVEAVIYPRIADEQGGFFVLVTNRGKASGTMTWRPENGERLLLEGAWGAYRGEKVFKFQAAMCDVPQEPEHKLAYVCERATGIGFAMRKAIWEKWGHEWEAKIEEDGVPRLGGRRWEALTEALELVNQDSEKAQTIAWLLSKGATLTMANAAWEEWEKDTTGIVQSNCYRLADLPGFGFQNVDQAVRGHFEIADGDPRRISAGVLYALHQLTSAGSTVIAWSELQVASVKLLGGLYRDMIAQSVSEMFEDGSLRGFKASESIALGQDFFNERDIWNYVNQKHQQTEENSEAPADQLRSA